MLAINVRQSAKTSGNIYPKTVTIVDPVPSRVSSSATLNRGNVCC